MIESVTYKGKWQIPGSTGSCSGTLTFDAVNGGQLEIVGNFSQGWSYKPVPIVQGHTTDGWVTLVECRPNGSHHSHVTNTGTSIYKPDFIFVGHSFDTTESIAFRSVTFTLFNLLEWMEPKGFDEQWPEKGYVLTYTRPEPIEFACYPGCKGNTTFAMRGSHCNELLEIHVRQHVEIRLEYDQKKSYVDILKDIFTFVRLVTFATYEQSYPTAIEFGDPELTDEFLEQRLKKTIPQTVTCYYQNGFYKPSFQQRYWQHHMLTFDSLDGKFSDLVPLWFEQADLLARPIELLLQFLSDKYDFSNDRFIEIAKALEAFHRLQYGTDIKYRQRLQDIVRDYSFPYFDKRVPDKDIFCQNTVKSRNYYTHLNELERAAH